jgi:Na+:H+ antiporter, NhaA family
VPPMNAPPSRQLRPATFLHRDSRLARMARPLAQFLRVEAAGGMLLAVAAAVALVWANSPWRAGYVALWATPVDISIGSFHLAEDLHGVVNDGLMAIFFFVVGLEIKREWTVGELRDRRQAALPAMAALGGMIVPALIYLAFNTGGPEGRGWGIPMATDIAFAVGVMALLGRRVPPPLKVFLLTLAIIDDLGAIVVIAVVYSDDLAPGYLLAAAAVVAAVAMLRRGHVTYPPIFVAAGVGLWLCLHESGVHATIAGVVMGLLTPAVALQPDLQTQAVVDALENRDELTAEEVRATAAAIKGSVSIAERVGELLHPWSSYVIVPLFALANAGIVLQRDALTGATSVFAGVGLGLIVGKCVGVTGFAWLTIRVGVAQLPRGVVWGQFVGAAVLAGIGFTVSLFITELAFTDDDLVAAAKLGILVASILAAVIGALVLVSAGRRRVVVSDDADR